jgi:hypothetical protein
VFTNGREEKEKEEKDKLSPSSVNEKVFPKLVAFAPFTITTCSTFPLQLSQLAFN